MNRRLGAGLLVAVGTILVLFGLLFLVGSAGKGRRLAVAAVSLAFGGVTAGFGVRAWRRADELLPERLEAAILDLAKREDGEISREEIDAALGWRAPWAGPALDRLVLDGRCRRETRDGTSYFIFPEIRPRLFLLVCEYCGAEYPLSSNVTSCPACGGPVSRRVVSRSLAGKDTFSMDESEPDDGDPPPA
ncbi:MAG TPA: hypothetical protein ENK19_02695 [Acidobacteria bacterium]|nr:hypothetical protein [Acidobacteriota bacterium]